METRHLVLTYEPVRFEQLADEIRDIQTRLAEVEETAESDDGLITVKVNARGDLLELELDPRLYRSPDSAALSREITETYRAARAAADERAFELTTRQLELTSASAKR
ncbi:YbaB/EbfC family nucleoid-associated protein [Prauserella cavernicola]|uniref:YbaB/EbfC family nucleoid-associated protein n=1 Tax=Prauserella cavernicola TaxID=2800127 RepID=A0A934V5X1_9PSEU|nr:YbaB/EbfC family nucleoid-associated protein [Prauserella cavernicola]MBK1786942.1 YbaB/EbfC family nucleoid-associated protein [Prauserella cavernicola]